MVCLGGGYRDRAVYADRLGHRAVRVLALPAGADLSHIAVAGSLAAVPAGDAVVLLHGPPAAAIRSLDYEGAHVAWSTDSCQLVADARAADSADRLPAGPCFRTEATSGVFGDVRPIGRSPVGSCASRRPAAARRDRVRGRARDRPWRPPPGRRAAVS